MDHPVETLPRETLATMRADLVLARRQIEQTHPEDFGSQSVLNRNVEAVKAITRGIALLDAIHPQPDPAAEGEAVECHKLDTPTHVFFYEQDFYVLSNFSAFSVVWYGQRFDTAEHAYHWMKFPPVGAPDAETYAARQRLLWTIADAPSAHAAFKLAQDNKHLRRADWDEVKVDVMREVLRAKVEQHEYVRRKLLATGERELVEDSWRDDFWGWGPNRDGQNMLGKLWMELRAELRAATAGAA